MIVRWPPPVSFDYASRTNPVESEASLMPFAVGAAGRAAPYRLSLIKTQTLDDFGNDRHVVTIKRAV